MPPHIMYNVNFPPYNSAQCEKEINGCYIELGLLNSLYCVH